MRSKPDYGVDAPGVIRNLSLCGLAALLLSLFLPVVNIGPLRFSGFGWISAGFLSPAVLMLLYSKVGKFRHSEAMVRAAALNGGEQVLDVGTGRGLLLIAAARKLTTGRAVGIDIWNAQDLSGNRRVNTEANIALEGVEARCELKEEPAQQMSFADASFDVVLSNMCLHNIEPGAERTKACREIVRVLKPGGVALISDFKNTGRYAEVFRQSGLLVTRKMHPFTTFPPVFVVTAKKPA